MSISTAPQSRHGTVPPISTVVFVVIFSAFWVVQGTFTYQRARHHDYLSFYTGATLITQGKAGQLYDLEQQRSVQQKLAPSNEEVIPFIRPNYYALALAPLSFLPFDAGFWVWILVHSLLLAGAWVWAGRYFGWDAMIFGALYFPTAAGITNGQDCVFMLLIGILSFRLLERGQDFRAGIAFGLSLIKFHLFLLVPLIILIRKRWEMFAGYCVAAIVALAGFLLLGGLDGAREYIELLQRDDLTWLSPAPELMVNVQSFGANFGIDSSWLSGVLVVLVVALTILGSLDVPMWRWFSLALIGSVLVTPHAYTYDAAILLLAIWLVLFRSPNPVPRIAAATLAVPLPFLSLLAGPPWSVLPALTAFVFLASLCWDNRRTGRSLGM